MQTASPSWADLVLAPASANADPGADADRDPSAAAAALPPDELVFCDVETAVAAIRAGRMVIVTDDENRENEGDLVMAAVHADVAAVNFMTQEGRGLVCVPLLPARLAALDLPLMVQDNTAPFATAFTIPVDARGLTTTGISAPDRAATIAALVDPNSRPADFVRPGHIFPLAARPGGVLERPGHTEAAVDLARLAGLPPAGVICEILAADGSMARGATLAAFARRHGLPVLSIATLSAALRGARGTEPLPAPVADPRLHLAAEADLPTDHGLFRALAFTEAGAAATHLALRLGLDNGATRTDGFAPLVRIHSECLTGDVFHSRRCDCGAQLDDALAMIAAEREGLLLYLRQEGRGIGLANKIRAYGLQDDGLDTVDANTVLGLPADGRDYSVAAALLKQLGLRAVRLITNNPAKVRGLAAHGIVVVAQVPRRPALTPENQRYLETKRDRMGHVLDLSPSSDAPVPEARTSPGPATEETFDMVHEGSLHGDGLTIGIVVARWNSLITRELLAGASDTLRRHGVAEGAIDIVWVPGAFEIPLAARWMAETGRYAAIVALGAVIRGGTPHFDHVANAALGGIAAVAQSTGVPVTAGILTTDSSEQALERAGIKAGNKGAEAAQAAIEMATLARSLRGQAR